MSAPADWTPDEPELGAVEDERLDWAAVEAHVREHLPALRGELDVEQFVRGGRHDAFRLRFGATLLALRVLDDDAPDPARTHAVLGRVAAAYDRAPAPLLLCPDADVAGAPFEVLQYQPGFVITDRLPNAFVNEPDAGQRIARAVARALADLHALEGGPVHGAFSLARCQFDADPEGGTPDRVTGVLGWSRVRENGSPEEDLQTLLDTWPGAPLGLPSAEEVAALYAATDRA